MPNPTSSRVPLILVLLTTADFYTSRLELSLLLYCPDLNGIFLYLRATLFKKRHAQASYKLSRSSDAKLITIKVSGHTYIS